LHPRLPAQPLLERPPHRPPLPPPQLPRPPAKRSNHQRPKLEKAMSATALSAHDSHGHHGSYLERRGGFWTTVWDWATTIDHKKIGVMYLVAILSMFFIGGVAALLVRLDLLTPVRSVIEADGTTHITGQLFGNGKDINTGNKWFNTMFTLHGAI